MIYRQTNESDISQLAQMRWDFRTVGKDVSSFDIAAFLAECCEFLKEGLSSGEWVCWVAEENGEIVSHIYIRRIRKFPKPSRLHDEIGYITNVYTKPEYRGKGIGSQLMQSVKQWATESDIELLFLWPSKRAVPFYEREGFSNKNEIMELILREE